SLADVCEDRPERHVPRAHLLSLIHRTPSLDWLLLTKRPENMRILAIEAARLAFDDGPTWKDAWPSNVWAGTSVENQEAADLRIPRLLGVPAAVRFLSCEPLLGPVDIAPWLWPQNTQMIACGPGGAIPAGDLAELRRYARFVAQRAGRHFVDWVICGGESGPGARPMDLAWARSLVTQCKAAGVACFVKQFGSAPAIS